MNRPWRYAVDAPAYPYGPVRDWLSDEDVAEPLDDVEAESAALTEMAWKKHTDRL